MIFVTRVKALPKRINWFSSFIVNWNLLTINSHVSRVFGIKDNFWKKKKKTFVNWNHVEICSCWNIFGHFFFFYSPSSLQLLKSIFGILKIFWTFGLLIFIFIFFLRENIELDFINTNKGLGGFILFSEEDICFRIIIIIFLRRWGRSFEIRNVWMNACFSFNYACV